MRTGKVMVLCLVGVAGAAAALLSMLGVFYWFSVRSDVEASLLPCTWHIRLQTASGQPVPGAELFVIDRRTGKDWPVGNWRGPGSLVTDDRGEVTFKIEKNTGFGGERRRFYGYVRNGVAIPTLVIRHQGSAVFAMPFAQALTVEGRITVTCSKEHGGE